MVNFPEPGIQLDNSICVTNGVWFFVFWLDKTRFFSGLKPHSSMDHCCCICSGFILVFFSLDSTKDGMYKWKFAAVSAMKFLTGQNWSLARKKGPMVSGVQVFVRRRINAQKYFENKISPNTSLANGSKKKNKNFLFLKYLFIHTNNNNQKYGSITHTNNVLRWSIDEYGSIDWARLNGPIWMNVNVSLGCQKKIRKYLRSEYFDYLVLLVSRSDCLHMISILPFFVCTIP